MATSTTPILPLNGACSLTNLQNELGIDMSQVGFSPMIYGQPIGASSSLPSRSSGLRLPNGIFGFAVGARSSAIQPVVRGGGNNTQQWLEPTLSSVKGSGEQPEYMQKNSLNFTTATNPPGFPTNPVSQFYTFDRPGVVMLPQAFYASSRQGLEMVNDLGLDTFTRYGESLNQPTQRYRVVADDNQIPGGFMETGMIMSVVVQDKALCTPDTDPQTFITTNPSLIQTAPNGVDMVGGCYGSMDGMGCSTGEILFSVPFSIALPSDGSRVTFELRTQKGYGEGIVVGLEIYNGYGEAYITSLKPAGQSYDRILHNLANDETANTFRSTVFATGLGVAWDDWTKNVALNQCDGVDAALFGSENAGMFFCLPLCGINERYGPSITVGQGPACPEGAGIPDVLPLGNNITPADIPADLPKFLTGRLVVKLQNNGGALSVCPPCYGR